VLVCQNFTAHEGPITCLDFHPTEYMLSTGGHPLSTLLPPSFGSVILPPSSTGSSDRTIKFWDLETFTLVSSADQQTTPIKAMTFTPDGSALLAGSQDALKVWGWEPVQCHDHMDVGWNKLADMKASPSLPTPSPSPGPGRLWMTS
jgi:katanin p80 WD40 repeat-containing subunit B1